MGCGGSTEAAPPEPTALTAPAESLEEATTGPLSKTQLEARVVGSSAHYPEDLYRLAI